MIGPHEGKELELMLAGKKHLAAFGDIIPKSGVIDEIIIPEKKFAPYVENGLITRHSIEFATTQNYKIRYVCFTLPNHEWRAHTYIFLRKKLHSKEIEYTNSIDQFIGYLLDYSKNDIEDFLNQGLQLD